MRKQTINLKYRDKLDIPKDITFGLELEFEYGETKPIEMLVNNNHTYHFYRDKTVLGKRKVNNKTVITGGEVISPILIDRKETWQELKEICNLLKINDAKILNNTGGHIHFGTNILGSTKALIKFIKIWVVFEPIIHKFSAGEFDKIRTRVNQKDRLISTYILDRIKEIDNCHNLRDLKKIIPLKKRYTLNFKNIKSYTGLGFKNTIEIRVANGSVCSAIWQNNVNFFYHLLIYCKNNQEEDQVLNQKIKELATTPYELADYDKCHEQEAQILIDLIFREKIDKEKFLTQYIK